MNPANALPVFLVNNGVSILNTIRDGLPEVSAPVMILINTEGVGAEDLGRLESFLSGDEIKRSLRFRFTRDRVSFIVVHGLLRWMLGRHFGISPEKVKIRYNLFGKPFVSGYDRTLFFNPSHSAGLSVLAFDPVNEIGADVEKIDEGFEFEPIAERFFTSRENRYVFSTEEGRRNRFYEIWTRKEAYLKALGLGITEHLHTEVLEQKMNTSVEHPVNANGNYFEFKSMMFQDNFRITLAVNGESGRIILIDPLDPENGTTYFDL